LEIGFIGGGLDFKTSALPSFPKFSVSLSDRWQPAGIFSFSIAPPLPFTINTQTGMSVLLSRQTKV
jgi:hypothetical protein